MFSVKNLSLWSLWSGKWAFKSGMVCSQALDPTDGYHNILLTPKQHHRGQLFSNGSLGVYIIKFIFQETPMKKNLMTEQPAES